MPDSRPVGESETSAPAITGADVRHEINQHEIGGECDDGVLQAWLCRRFGVTPIEATSAIHDAHADGYIKAGFWAKTNWAPRSDLHPYPPRRP